MFAEVRALCKSCKPFTNKDIASTVGRGTVKRPILLNEDPSGRKKAGSSSGLCTELLKLNFQVSHQKLKPDGSKM